MEPVGIIGVGRLGICLALVLEQAGFTVYCYDVNKDMLHQIKEKTLQSPEPSVNEMLRVSTRLHVCSSMSELFEKTRIHFCVVATPSLPDGSYNHAYVNSVVDEIVQFQTSNGSPSRHFIVCCTTMPGYCDTVQERLKDLHVDVSYNPEFIAQGDIVKGMTHPDMVLIGEANKETGDVLEQIYKKFLQKEARICRMGRHQAEITKIALNCFVTTKITFANLIGDIAHAAGLDHAPILKAIGSDSRVGTKYFNWGHGYGGPCFPRDNRALSLYAESVGQRNLIGEITDSANNIHCFRLKDIVVKKCGNKPVLVRDLAYRKGTVIIEESQSYKLATLLALEGCRVILQDSKEILDLVEKEHGPLFEYRQEGDVLNSDEYFVIDNSLQSLYM